jgi:hypothetical protein
MLLLGVPAFHFLRSRGWTAWWIAVVWGGFCGAVAYTLCNLFFFWLLNGERLDLELKATFDVFLLFPIVAGAMVGILFWFIARPDRKPVS